MPSDVPAARASSQAQGRAAMLTIRQAQTSGDIDTVRKLFREYQTLLGVDLCFQGFEAEIQGLPGDYAPPGGRLFLASNDGVPVGCVALRALAGSRCEMKRLFVRPASLPPRPASLWSDNIFVIMPPWTARSLTTVRPSKRTS